MVHYLVTSVEPADGGGSLLISRRNFNIGLASSAAWLGTGISWAGVDAGEARPDPLAMVDPELRGGAERLLAMGHREWSQELLLEIRDSVPPAVPPLDPPSPTVETRSVPGLNGQPDVRVEVIGRKDTDQLRPAIVHIHGGGLILGRVQDMTAFCQKLSEELDCLIVNVDYRLSPETRFPGPVEDNYAALHWLSSNAKDLGVNTSRIAVMGESAGGGLAAMVAILARDRGEIPLCYQLLIYPMLDDRTGSTHRVPPHIGTIGWNESGNRFGWTSFLGVPAGSPKVPYGAVPARIDNLAGLPPAFIGVGAIDLFVDENIEYARRLVNAGVSCQLNVIPGAYHAFEFVVPEARVSREFIAAWKSALRSALAT
jgi:acetyl esterase/lipase